MTEFQSTHPHGVRHVVDTDTGEILTVSIHAPTRGATQAELSKSNPFKVSIHAPTRGATLSKVTDITRLLFQSTHPHGVRLDRESKLTPSIVVSIHAPTRGATTAGFILGLFNNSFNPRTHTGCDRVHAADTLSSLGFNPRTHTGCDLKRKAFRIL